MSASDYYDMTASWEQKNGVDGDGQSIFAAALTIDCYRADKTKLIKTPKGREVISSASIYTKALVEPEDRIDGAVVLNVDKFYMDGEEDERVAYL